MLWLIKGLGPGGAEELLRTHARCGDHTRFDYHAAYVVTAKSHHVADLRAAGVTVHHLDQGSPLDPRWPVRLRRLLVDEDIDVVHAHSPLLAAQSRLVVRTMRPRPGHLSTEHNRWPRHRRGTRWANGSTIALEDHVIAVSADVADTVVGHSRSRIEVLSHGILTDDHESADDRRGQVRAQWQAGPDDIVWICVANFRREKRLDVLVDAIGSVSDPHVRLVHVGQGPLAEEVTDRARSGPARDRVEFLGHRSDVARLLQGADGFVLSSDHEGLPVALMEALAAGLPVVATSVGGIPEAVTDGLEAVLVEPGDPQALADALAAVSADADARAEMAHRSRNRSADFDGRRAVGRLEEIYTELSRRS